MGTYMSPGPEAPAAYDLMRKGTVRRVDFASRKKPERCGDEADAQLCLTSCLMLRMCSVVAKVAATSGIMARRRGTSYSVTGRGGAGRGGAGEGVRRRSMVGRHNESRLDLAIEKRETRVRQSSDMGTLGQ